MKWIKFKIKTNVAAEDIIISSLYDIGLEGAQIEDKVPLTALEKEQMFVDILPDVMEDDGIAWLSFFMAQPEAGGLIIDGTEMTAAGAVGRIEAELERIRAFIDIGAGTVSVSATEDLDWINNWKQYFHQFTIDDLVVVPSWEAVKTADAGKTVLHIDPGTAFGTGMHETTQLCIRQLRRYVTDGSRILDIGSGSGILAIVALMFGAGEAVGTDLDPCALAAVAENCRANQIAALQFKMLLGNIITDRELQAEVGYDGYDIVTANILTEVLVPLTPVIVRHLKKGGLYITSGILSPPAEMSVAADKAAVQTAVPEDKMAAVQTAVPEDKMAAVQTAVPEDKMAAVQTAVPEDKVAAVKSAVLAAGMEIVEVNFQGEWAAVTARKL